MSNKFNASSLSEYCKSYARKLVGDFYAHHSVITGPELLRISPVSQVNLFVVSSLSEKWRSDAERFRSPYFDYENSEVQQALQEFMNTVSQFISVRREHLEPLLVEATRRTLVLLFDPHYYFDEVLRNQPEFSLSAEAAHQITRYTQINKFIPATFEERMKGKTFVYVNQALGWLDEMLVQRSRELEKPDKYIALFSEKVPLDPALLLRKSYDFHQPQTPQTTNKSFFETDVEEIIVPPTSAPFVEPQPATNGSTPAISLPDPLPMNESASSDEESSGGPLFLDDSSSSRVEPVAPSMQPSQASVRSSETSTLAETIRQPETEADGPVTVGETFFRAPIESISKSISLNQKFMFINQLFHGNAGAYNEVIEELNRATDYDQARNLLANRYAAQYQWDMNSDEVAMLIEILKRRFV